MKKKWLAVCCVLSFCLVGTGCGSVKQVQNADTSQQTQMQEQKKQEIEEAKEEAERAQKEKDKFEAGLHQVILSDTDHAPSADQYATEYHEVMDQETLEDGTICVYAFVYRCNYEMQGTTITNRSASSMPCAITMKVSGDSYELVDYWEPADGEDYVASIRDRFPDTIENHAISDHMNPDVEMSNCMEQLQEQMNAAGIDCTFKNVVGVIQEVKDNGYLLQVDEASSGEFYHTVADQVWVEDSEASAYRDQVGEEVSLYYDGTVQETYPPQISVMESCIVE